MYSNRRALRRSSEQKRSRVFKIQKNEHFFVGSASSVKHSTNNAGRDDRECEQGIRTNLEHPLVIYDRGKSRDVSSVAALTWQRLVARTNLHGVEVRCAKHAGSHAEKSALNVAPVPVGVDRACERQTSWLPSLAHVICTRRRARAGLQRQGSGKPARKVATSTVLLLMCVT